MSGIDLAVLKVKLCAVGKVKMSFDISRGQSVAPGANLKGVKSRIEFEKACVS